MFLVNGGRLPYYVPRMMDNGLGHELHLIAPVRAAPTGLETEKKSSISCALKYDCAEVLLFVAAFCHGGDGWLQHCKPEKNIK
jgi:hypothetical protein